MANKSNIPDIDKDPFGFLIESGPESHLQKAFYTFLASEFSSENSKFIEAVKLHNNNKSSFTKEQVEKSVHNIYSKHIKADSDFEINISAAQRKNFKKNMQEDPIPDDIFDAAYSEIKSMIGSDSFSRFQRTDEFKKAKSLDKEPLGVEVTNAKSLDKEPLGVEMTNAKSLDKEPLGVEVINAKTLDKKPLTNSIIKTIFNALKSFFKKIKSIFIAVSF